MLLITCIDDRKYKLVEIGKCYMATEEDSKYIIHLKENNIIPHDKYRRKYIKVDKKSFVKEKIACII